MSSTTIRLSNLKQDLRDQADPAKAAFFPRFFKSGPGEYGEGDQFLGVTVPKMRQIAKTYADLDLSQVENLINSPWHEERLTALMILVFQWRSRSVTKEERQSIYEFYLSHTSQINNWDLVDLSAPTIVGEWLLDQPNRQDILDELAVSPLVWDRRIAMLATFAFIKQGRPDPVIAVADMLIEDKHDLIQKAVGWMLRELGKRVDTMLLTDYLDRHAATMPRTALRYSIEHLSDDKKRYYMNLKNA